MKRSEPPKRRKGLRRASKRFREAVSARMTWSQAVKQRDGCCQMIGCRETVGLQAHHVRPKGRYPDLALALENGLALCRGCHKTWHRSSKLHMRWWEATWPDRAEYVNSLLSEKIVVDTQEQRA